MRQRAGQAWHWCRRIVGFVILAALLLVGGTAWRLAQGPVELPMLARQIERAVAGSGGVRLEIGGAAIAWEGWRAGSAAPLDIRLEGVRLIDAAGVVRAELPEASATLSVRALLQGRLAPATIELRRPSLLLTRELGGGISLGAGMDWAAEGERAASPAGGGTPLADLLTALHRTAHGQGQGAEPGAAVLASFRRLRIQGGTVAVQDRALDRHWAVDGTTIEIRRSARGGLTAEGAGSVAGDGVHLPVRLSASMPDSEPPRLTAELVLPALHPAQLAALWPELAPLRLLDAAVTLGATATFSAAGEPAQAQARLLAGAGHLDFGHGRRLPFAGFGATVEGDAGLFRLSAATLRLPGQDGPVLQASGAARRGAEGWTADLALLLPSLSLAALPGLWPESLAPATRGPVLATLGAGTLRDLALDVGLTAGPDFADLGLREAKAGFALEHASLAIGAAAALIGADGLAPTARVVAERLRIAARATPLSLSIDTLELRLPAPGEGAPVTAITAGLEARRPAAGEAWQGRAQLGLDAVRVTDLPHLWPAGLARGARGWITENITAGSLRNGQWQAEAVLRPGAGGPDITALTGSAEILDATVHWLRPVPPIQGISGTVSFTLPEIVIRTQGGRQLVGASATTAELPRQARPGRSRAPPQPPRLGPGVDLRDATIRLTDLDAEPERAEIDVALAGGLPEVMAVLRHPRLHLFDRRPLEIAALSGQAEARLSVGVPMLADIPVEQMRLKAAGRVTDAQLTEVLLGHALERAAFDFAVDLDGLKLTGGGVMADAPVRATVELDFRAGAAAQVTERAQVSVPAANAAQLTLFGLDTAGLMSGTAAVEARYERRRNGQGSVALRADLRAARFAFDTVGWLKPVGMPGSAEATLRLNGDALVLAEGLSVEGGGLTATGRIAFGAGNRMERVEIAPASRLGTTQFGGAVTRPARQGGPWTVALRGPVADLAPFLSGSEGDAPPPARSGRTDTLAPAGPSFALDLRFDRGTTGEDRNLRDLVFLGEVDGHGMLRSARITGRTGRQAPPQLPPLDAFEMTLTPRGGERHLTLTAADGGALLQALDLSDSISGGRLVVNGSYRELRAGAPLSGTAELDGFAVRDAPGLGKLLQAMTLYGVLDAMRGGTGLVFTRLVAPFQLTREALVLEDARAFSASLGLTAKGQMLRRERMVDIEGTVVPAYFFNQLLGNIPILGRLFSPERGGGLFAATYRLRGPSNDPTVTVNPLAALTPGFLRGLFGLAEGGRGAPVPNPTDR